MIEIVHISKSYILRGVRKHIFEDMNFHIQKNQNLAIVGPNGVGKSTLMRLISGAELPDSGYIQRNVHVSWPLGFSGGFNGSMTGIENIRFVARVYGADPQKAIDYVADFSELGKSLTLPIKTYSSGMKARLAFGMSMAIHFDCYLIDEITAVGDATFKRKSKQVFEEKLANSRIIMISHSMNQLRDYCNCGLMLTPEGVVYYDNMDDLIKHYNEIS